MSGAIVAMLSSDWPRRVPSWASRSGIISAVAAELPASQPCRHWTTSSGAAHGQRDAGARNSAHLTATPAKCQMSIVFIGLDSQGDIIEQRAQQLLAIA